MNPQIYAWSNDYFCDGCICYAMIGHHPWSQWAEEHELSGFTTTQALGSMLQYFDLLAKPVATRTAMGFPIRVNNPDCTIFCATCLSLLHQVP